LRTLLQRFLCEEEGQDLIEYTLLIAFIALTSAAIFAKAGTGASNVWRNANTILASAALVGGS
jgi:Flp pilus assembly pilin Flp